MTAIETDELHGWEIRGVGKLHVGHVPTRKQACVYVIDGSVMHVVAYCRSEDEAHRLVRFLDAAFAAVAS